MSGSSLGSVGRLASFALAAAVAGCDGSNGGSQGATDATGGTMEDAPSDVDPSASLDGSVTSPDAGADVQVPPTAVTKRIVAGNVKLVGDWLASCTNQIPASGNGDRWCAFSRPGELLGKSELWVVNVSRAIAMSGSVACDGTDASCRRLSQDLWTGQPEAGPSHPSAHRFDGDTLIYHADAVAATDVYRGPIYAWRPDWPAPKRISSAKAVTCSGHDRKEVALCLENLTAPGVIPLELDLTAGKIGGDSPLPTVARIVPFREPDGANQWGATFSPSGDHFVWSSGGKTPQEVETLRIAKSDEPATPLVTVKDTTDWKVSNDGKRLYYLRAYGSNMQGEPSGTLTMASFPDGAGETKILEKVLGYQLLSDDTGTDVGIGFFDGLAGGGRSFKIMRDPVLPTMVSKVADGVADARVSVDLKSVYFSKQVDFFSGATDAFIGKTDGTGPCTLQSAPTTARYGDPFLPSARVVFWADAVRDNFGDGWYASSDDCSGKTMFARFIDTWFPLRTGLLYSDEADGSTVTLRHSALVSGKGLAAAAIIRDKIARLYGVIPDRDLVVFTVEQRSQDDGLYVHGPLGSPAR